MRRPSSPRSRASTLGLLAFVGTITIDGCYQVTPSGAGVDSSVATPLASLGATDQTLGSGTACYVYVAGDCHDWVPQATWFADDWNGAALNSAVCLHRARDYATWCGLQNPDDRIYAAFTMDDALLVAQVFEPGFDFGNVDPHVITFGVQAVTLITSIADTSVVGAADPAISRLPDIWTMTR